MDPFSRQPSQRQPTRGNGMPLMARLIPIIIGLVGVFTFMTSNCQKGPFGRPRILGLKPEEENALGLQAFQQVRAEEGQKGNLLRADDPLVKRVREITVDLINASRQPEVLQHFQLTQDNFDWAVDVIRSDQANAFCLPGGKMVVYTGIIPIAQTDAALSAVIGHEISHALARHGAERMGIEELKKRGMASVAGGLGDFSPGQQQMILSAIGMAANFGGTLPFSREHESEADRMGLILMAAAGYDPREAIGFWERMREGGGGKGVPEFMSTHPGHETRIEQLREWQTEAAPFYQRAERQQTQVLPGLRFSGSVQPTR